MKHYLNPETNEIYAYELDGSQDDIIPESYVLLDDIALNEKRNELSNLEKQKYENDFNKQPWDVKRQMSYPHFTDYLDGIVKGDSAQIQKYIDSCLAIKAKYPKP